MKNLVIFFLFFSLSSFVFSQNEKSLISTELQSIELSAGESYLSGGYSLGFGFKSPNAKTFITLREDNIFVNHFLSAPKIKSALGPSGGYFLNVPFVGAIAKVSPAKFVSTLHWVGYSFGDPGASMNIEPSFLFLINNINFNIWKFKAYYCNVVFLENMKHVFGVSYEHQMTKHIFLNTDIAYDLTNSKQLLKAGIVWRR